MKRIATSPIRIASCVALGALLAASPSLAPAGEKLAPETIFVEGATIWTQGPAGRIESGQMIVRDGVIVAVGTGLEVPDGAHVIDASGKHVTPGLIDCHSHTAIRGGVNEGSNNITAEVRIEDVIDPNDVNIYRQLAGGLTTAHLLHGSANSIGGQDAVIKLRRDATREELLMKDAPRGIKFALGENPKRSNFRRPGTPQRYPATRIGVNLSIRAAFLEAQDYGRRWSAYEALSSRKQAREKPPRRNLQLEAILEILNGERRIHSHSYRQDEILALIRLAEEFGVTIGTFQHVLEGYKVADEIAQHGAGASTFSDWWAYKLEAYDAIPYNGALMHDRGVIVSFNSDSSELARRMNLEAAKAVKYGGIDEESALAFVTSNAARQLGIFGRVGSLEPDKDADFVVWSSSPLSVYSIAIETWVDGVREFERGEDQERRELIRDERERLAAEILAESGKKGKEDDDEAAPEAAEDVPEGDVRFAPHDVPYRDRLASLAETISIVGATVHTMSGPPIEDGTVSFRAGRIVEVGAGLAPLDGARVVDASGRHVFPGFIDANNAIGLTEIGAVAASNDVRETGDVNPNVNTAIAVNPDSELIPVARASGLTHALTVPGGGTVRGTSALIRLDGWTWEDLTAASPVAMHITWPRFRTFRSSFPGAPSRKDQQKRREESLERIEKLFRDARAYLLATKAHETEGRSYDADPVLEAVLPVLSGTIPVIVHAGDPLQIESAIEWADEEKIRLVIAGDDDIWRAAELLASRRIPVLLTSVLTLPMQRDDPYDTPYTAALRLHEAGVLFAFAGSGSAASSARNLPYHAAMAVAFGLPLETAYRALTLNPAQILGLARDLGSIEPGKSASLIITDGDPLEITTHVVASFIDGREVNLTDNRHRRLYDRYAERPSRSSVDD